MQGVLAYKQNVIKIYAFELFEYSEWGFVIFKKKLYNMIFFFLLQNSFEIHILYILFS